MYGLDNADEHMNVGRKESRWGGCAKADPYRSDRGVLRYKPSPVRVRFSAPLSRYERNYAIDMVQKRWYHG